MAQDTNKIIQALTFFAYREKGQCIDYMKAYKLLWLADRHHVRTHGRTVTGDTYCALPLGLVPSDAMNYLNHQDTALPTDIPLSEQYIYNPRSKKRVKTFKALQDADMDEFSDSDIESLQLIYDNFHDLSAKQLSELSHDFPDWQIYASLLRDPSCLKSYIIDTDLFFSNPASTHFEERVKRVFSQSPEKLEAAQSYFNEYHKA